MPIQSNVQVMRQPQMKRGSRHPQHPFQLSHLPFVIAPFFIAPVLAGETLKSLRWQCRSVTDPIANRLVGWWSEQSFYYVKLSDLDEWEGYLENMLLDPAWDPTPIDGTGDIAEMFFEAGPGSGKLNFVRMCLARVVDEYFRDEGTDITTAGTYYGSNYRPYAKVTGNSVLNSVMPEAAWTPPDAGITVGVDDIVTIGEIDAARRQFEFLQMNGAIDMTYEDYLRMFGVRVPASLQAKRRRPELIRFARNWTYPVAAIDPNDGSAAAACTWSIAESADKDRFFNEPGFLFGVQVVRPKHYFRNHKGSFTAEMSSVQNWLPMILNDDPATSMKLIADAGGPLGDVTDAGGYWVDLKDLFLYGEQYVNFTMSDAADDNSLSLPGPALDNAAKWYPEVENIKTLFVAAGGGVVKTDGIVQLHIASHLRDTSK